MARKESLQKAERRATPIWSRFKSVLWSADSLTHSWEDISKQSKIFLVLRSRRQLERIEVRERDFDVFLGWFVGYKHKINIRSLLYLTAWPPG